MVSLTFATTYPPSLGDAATVVPLDVGRWAVITGPEVERRRLANELRLLSRGRGRPGAEAA